MKNNVSGIAGAARINQLTRADLTRAERHGKREDMTGKSRAISKEPPVTTTGLDLNALFEQHVAGAFVPKAHSKAMQVLVQFPTDLVDGEDAAGMLRHARAFTQRVFGDAAIFADRVDRDEKSRQVVDLFVVPKYTKQTKHQSKTAVSMSNHLKALAKEYGHPTGPHGTVRALQDALFEYLRDDMGLTDVKRGTPKQVPGPDWKSAEQQRVEELDELTAQAQATQEQIERDQAAVQVDQAATAAALAAASCIADQAEEDRRAARADRVESSREATARVEALATRERQAAEREEAIAAREAEIAVAYDRATAAQYAAEQARAITDAAVQAARRSGEAIDRERIAIGDERAAAEADRACAAAERIAARAEHERVGGQRRLQEAQLGLLARGADDEAGLDLRRTTDAFSMRKEAMRPRELVAHEADWSASLMKVARQIAAALEQARTWARRLLAREKVIEDREAALVARERDAERVRVAQQAEHAASLADLQRRAGVLATREEAAAQRMAEAETSIAAATAKDADAQALLTRHSRWATAVETIIDHPDWIDVTGITIRLNQGAGTAAESRLASTLREQPPGWALNAILARLDVADRRRQADEHVQAAAWSVEQLKELVSRAGPLLTPEQQKVTAEAQQAIRRSMVAAQAWNAARENGR